MSSVKEKVKPENLDSLCVRCNQVKLNDYSITFTCDNCGVQEHNNGSILWRPEWIGLRIPAKQHHKYYDLCSWECLASFLAL